MHLLSAKGATAASRTSDDHVPHPWQPQSEGLDDEQPRDASPFGMGRQGALQICSAGGVFRQSVSPPSTSLPMPPRMGGRRGRELWTEGVRPRLESLCPGVRHRLRVRPEHHNEKRRPLPSDCGVTATARFEISASSVRWRCWASRARSAAVAARLRLRGPWPPRRRLSAGAEATQAPRRR